MDQKEQPKASIPLNARAVITIILSNDGTGPTVQVNPVEPHVTRAEIGRGLCEGAVILLREPGVVLPVNAQLAAVLEQARIEDAIRKHEADKARCVSLSKNGVRCCKLVHPKEEQHETDGANGTIEVWFDLPAEKD